MTVEQFESSLQHATPPAGVSDLLKAMWYDGNGDWEASHNIAQDIQSTDGSWVHAYLHRKEGDESNAAYWYRRASKPFPKVSLSEEWKQLVTEFLKKR